MSTNEARFKISQDRTEVCQYCVGDRVIAVFRKYGIHKYEAVITEVCENAHGLEGVWISIKPLKALDPTDTSAKMHVDMNIGMMLPLKDIKGFAN